MHDAINQNKKFVAFWDWVVSHRNSLQKPSKYVCNCLEFYLPVPYKEN